MKNFAKLLTRHVLRFGNGYLTPLTDVNLVSTLIRKLAPTDPCASLIRLGPNGDGGYLVPNDLVGIKACFSPGVCLVSGFEEDCANLGMNVYMADASVSKPAATHPNFHFMKKYVGATTSQDFMTIDDWVSQMMGQDQSDLLLQIDIEGFEYESFLSMSDKLMGRFRVIIVEFHNLDQLWNRPYFEIISRAFEKILQTHECVHIHPNNCYPPLKFGGLSIPPVAEFTFLRKDRLTGQPIKTKKFPHPLDYDCCDNPHYKLPACWYE